MKYRFIWFAFGLFSLFSASAESIDWESFLAPHDLRWEKTPKDWGESAFLGNGLLGTCLWAAKGETLHWDIGRSDLYAGTSRVPVGKFVLKTKGKPTGFSMRQSIWNADAKGKIQTESGTIHFRSIVPHDQMVVLSELKISGKETPSIEILQTAPVSPNILKSALQKKYPHIVDFDTPEGRKEALSIAQKKGIPEPQKGQSKEIQWLTQPFAKNGGYALAWALKKKDASHYLFVFTLEPFEEKTPTPDLAVERVKEALKAGYSALEKPHQAWWHTFLSKSYLHIPNARLEQFYWLQMYKLGAATRSDGVPMDLMGPWFRATPWPKIWVNLNFQLAYWPIPTSNHLELMEPVWSLFSDYADNFSNAVRNPDWRKDSMAAARAISIRGESYWNWEYGNLIWMLHDAWLAARREGTDAHLRDPFFPTLEKAVNFMLHALEKDKNGVYHIPPDISPEYKFDGKVGNIPDNTYNLSMLRWGLQTLIYLNKKLNLNRPNINQWNEVLDHLPPYATDETGLMIGYGVPLSVSHRHFSHLLLFYPLHLLNPEVPKDRALIEKSLAHWTSMREGWRRYSCNGAAAMYAWLGDGATAETLLNDSVDPDSNAGGHLHFNSFYTESGPCIETPLSVASSLQEMVLQSWSSKPDLPVIRIFPAIPPSWKDAEFRDLRAEGGFLVSAQQKARKLQWVRIKSLSGNPFLLHAPFPKNAYRIKGIPPKKIVKKKDGMIGILLEKGA